MSKFGVRQMNALLKERGILLPPNVLAYGFSSLNERSRGQNLTLQQHKERRLQADVRRLAEEGYPFVWFLHLDARKRNRGEGLHVVDNADSVRIFSVASDRVPSLNVTDHPSGVCVDRSDLTQAEVDRYASWRPGELEEARVQTAVEEEPNGQDERRRRLAAIVMRQGQRAFRAALITAYRGRCAVTGSDCEEVLEAAHIRPYSGPQSNRTSNGLLLRADIHTLFDLNLLAIEPDTLTVKISKRLYGSTYRDLDGNRLEKVTSTDQPDKRVLAERWRYAMLCQEFE